ncbi:uncharacterized protein LOC105778468 isoform X1 [Gossypium raimondii]|uniref:Diphosphomevalonate decarboxylase-like N-terminal domain-containing protein n=1 Tax=Gossypium raimondii TaxID=29730 RepID=A0A0D2VJ50_GOSRA|nr:uncharacterized protein LOC105778468 isoform X1 [Gossypium raimondii]XP_052477742.1 uncharacterized protein LOC105778468 isoform X1 [Gossypium raimondii]KJB70289.1 hypothetical protein B456_011G067100 [Gossypium raimondii]KJB70290.1 hypothetical protein B456_011G067100 [Gossypium raimondii]
MSLIVDYTVKYTEHVFPLAKLMNVSEDESQLSVIARQGSGSACRSLFSGFIKWIMGKERCRGIELQSFWVCVHAIFGHDIQANLEMSFGCSQTMTLRRD